jgi:cell division protein FtsI/penicillin-binding protein 2
VFAAVAERLTGEELEAAADRLGVNRTVGWNVHAFLDGRPLRQWEDEEAGTVFAEVADSSDGGTRAQTGIGQRDVLLTPLAAANLVVTLLHDGQVKAPRVVREIRYADGSRMALLPEQRSASPAGSVSRAAARALSGWMADVVRTGTGHKLRQARWDLAGKSGTAQVITAGGEREHQWFIGYGPVDKPRYAVAVVALNRPAASRHQGIEAFGQIMNALAEQ